MATRPGRYGNVARPPLAEPQRIERAELKAPAPRAPAIGAAIRSQCSLHAAFETTVPAEEAEDSVGIHSEGKLSLRTLTGSAKLSRDGSCRPYFVRIRWTQTG
jgi:hypothetical protein